MTAATDVSKGQTDMSYKDELQTLTKQIMRHQVCPSKTCHTIISGYIKGCDIIIASLWYHLQYGFSCVETIVTIISHHSIFNLNSACQHYGQSVNMSLTLLNNWGICNQNNHQAGLYLKYTKCEKSVQLYRKV